MAICSHESGNMGSSMCHTARVRLMIDDAVTCFSGGASIDGILF